MDVARAVAIFISLLAMCCVVPRAAAQQSTDIVVSQPSVRINGVNVRTGPKVATVRYFSLAAAEKALGRPEQTYRAGLGVQVYSWRKVGVNFQEGFRASDKNKLFKFQVWLADSPMNAQDNLDGRHDQQNRVCRGVP